MPSLLVLLKSMEKYVSARDGFQKESKDPAVWKRLAFEKIIEKNDCGRRIGGVLSVGDQWDEWLALKHAIGNRIHCCGQTVKFLDTPDIEELIEQHVKLSSNLVEHVAHGPLEGVFQKSIPFSRY
jgi:hypothetical protein